MNHKIYMQRCIQLAKNGLGTTYPNPMVGSVIVHEGKIIGEGWHQKAGTPHAEVHAINSVKNKKLLPQSTIYVSLEPCSHFGKTPPCSDLIIHYKIPKVVIGTMDPNEKVAGKGIEKLRNAGIEVTVELLEKKCVASNKRFFTYHKSKRPYIILKWAESADGFLAPEQKSEKKPVWITNAYSRQLVHKWRTEEEAILVGTTTVLVDNPQLNARNWFGKNPLRIVLDCQGKITEDYAVKDRLQKTIIITAIENNSMVENLMYENCIFDSYLPNKIIDYLYHIGIQSLIIEGGQKTLQSFIDADLWNEARIFKGTCIFNKGTRAPVITGKTTAQKNSLTDQLLILKNHD